jgi:hypothetical protein
LRARRTIFFRDPRSISQTKGEDGHYLNAFN